MKQSKDDEQKLRDINAAKSANRLAKYGKAGPHSSKKGAKGYNRKKKHKEKGNDD
jgi:hypothetical protein